MKMTMSGSSRPATARTKKSRPPWRDTFIGGPSRRIRHDSRIEPLVRACGDQTGAHVGCVWRAPHPQKSSILAERFPTEVSLPRLTRRHQDTGNNPADSI